MMADVDTEVVNEDVPDNPAELYDVTDIVVDDVTTSKLPGSGAFDEFMSAHQVRLEAEYAANRIKGTDYAKVYLAAMESSMQQGITFVLERQKAVAAARLIVSQTIKTDEETANLGLTGELIAKQVEKMDAEIALAEKQVIKMDSEIALMDQQIDNLKSEQELIKANIKLKDQEILVMEQQVLKSKAEVDKMQYEVDLMQQQVLKMEADIVLSQKQAVLIDAEITKMEADTAIAQESLKKMYSEIELVDQQVLNMKETVIKSKQEIALLIEKTLEAASETQNMLTKNGKTFLVEGMQRIVADDVFSGTILKRQQAVNAKLEEPVIKGQAEKLVQEAYLIANKGHVSLAQISNTDLTGKYTVSDNSIIGKQKQLYQAQIDGFATDAEIRKAKLAADTFAVMRSTDESFPLPFWLEDAYNEINL